MSINEAKETLRKHILTVLPKLDVNNGKYQLIFTQGYMLVWKYIKDYAKTLNIDSSKIKKGGKLDPIFTYLNDYMYPLDKPQPTPEDIATKINAAADEYIAKAKKYSLQ